jgi:hypothetical protein
MRQVASDFRAAAISLAVTVAIEFGARPRQPNPIHFGHLLVMLPS